MNAVLVAFSRKHSLPGLGFVTQATGSGANGDSNIGPHPRDARANNIT